MFHESCATNIVRHSAAAIDSPALLFCGHCCASRSHEFLTRKSRARRHFAGGLSEAVRDAGAETPSTTGSLWVSSGPLSSLASDYKARWPGDLIVVRLVDTFSAATSGENNTSRQFSTQSAITGLLGKFGPSNALQNMFNANSAHRARWKGRSTMSSNLQLSLSGRVVDVLPNGVLVIEAVRDFTVGNDRQTVTLRGLVRPG